MACGPAIFYGYRVHGPYDPAKPASLQSQNADRPTQRLSTGYCALAAHFGYGRTIRADLSFDVSDSARYAKGHFGRDEPGVGEPAHPVAR